MIATCVEGCVQKVVCKKIGLCIGVCMTIQTVYAVASCRNGGLCSTIPTTCLKTCGNGEGLGGEHTRPLEQSLVDY